MGAHVNVVFSRELVFRLSARPCAGTTDKSEPICRAPHYFGAPYLRLLESDEMFDLMCICLIQATRNGVNAETFASPCGHRVRRRDQEHGCLVIAQCNHLAWLATTEAVDFTRAEGLTTKMIYAKFS